MNWIISANSEMYDHSSSFEHFGFIDWRQGKTKYEVGDTIYIYCTRPIQMIQYKCLVERINLPFDEIRDDEEYWLNKEEYTKSLNGNFIRLRLIEQVSNKHMKLENLLKNGLNAAPQSPVRIMSVELLNYIENFFTDKYQIDFFPELLNEDENLYEGAKKNVTVNKYERSSKARENAVKFHGLSCKVCGINFENIYGKVGSDFIHIHHLVPINEIGKNYKIDYEKDLIPVCPNCHSMLHRKINGKEPTVDELKNMMTNKKTTA
jgi:5-methylcytosine-specific restriction enzyme A